MNMAYQSMGAITATTASALAVLMPAYQACNTVTGGAAATSGEYQDCLQRALPQAKAGIPAAAIVEALQAEKQGRTWMIAAGVGALALIGGAVWLTRKKRGG